MISPLMMNIGEGRMPLHKLVLKINAAIMLLQNLSSKRGLCNGVRLKVVKIYTSLFIVKC